MNYITEQNIQYFIIISSIITVIILIFILNYRKKPKSEKCLIHEEMALSLGNLFMGVMTSKLSESLESTKNLYESYSSYFTGPLLSQYKEVISYYEDQEKIIKQCGEIQGEDLRNLAKKHKELMKQWDKIIKSQNYQ